MNGVVKMSRTDKDKKGARGNSATGKKKLLKGSLSHHSLPVDLTPGEAVTVKLVKSGYTTQEFPYTVPTAAATVTKTMVAVVDVRSKFWDITGYPGPFDAGKDSTIFKNVPGNCGTTRGIVNIAVAELNPSGIVIHEFCRKSVTLSVGSKKGINANQKGGSCSLAGMEIGWISINKPAGTYYYGIKTWGESESEPSYPPIGTTTANASSMKVTVKEAKGTLSVTTTPAGATVKVGTETKTSPCFFFLAPGTYTVTITKSGYDTITDMGVVVVAGETTTKSYLLTLSEVTITFKALKEDTTELTGTSVYINGVLKGTT